MSVNVILTFISSYLPPCAALCARPVLLDCRAELSFLAEERGMRE